MKPITDEEIALLKKLQKAGIKLTIFAETGYANLDPEDVQQYLEDPIGLIAEINGVTVENYLKWLKHRTEPVCPAITKRRTPCKNHVSVVHLHEYKPGFSDYCNFHKENI